MSIENPQATIFYSIEKAIKTYRQFAQRRLGAVGLNITLDQALLLRALHDHPEASQSEIGNLIFKDYASVTRMIELLVKKRFLTRSMHGVDRRRYRLQLSSEGKKVLKHLNGVIADNRAQAKKKITRQEIEQLRSTLNKIINNCQNDKL